MKILKGNIVRYKGESDESLTNNDIYVIFKDQEKGFYFKDNEGVVVLTDSELPAGFEKL